MHSPYGYNIHRREGSSSWLSAERSQKRQAFQQTDRDDSDSQQPADPPPEHDQPCQDYLSLYHIAAATRPTVTVSSSTNHSGHDPAAAAHIRPAPPPRHRSPSAHLTGELWAEIWMHPRISHVVEERIQQLSQGEFKFTIPFQLMHIFDLQTVYLLSNAGWSDVARAEHSPTELPRVRFPDKILLEPTQAIRLARELSRAFVNNHIGPAAYVQREMQLRALVSVLSYVRLCVGAEQPGRRKKPQLGHEAHDALQRNIRKLWQDLSLSQGSAADKGDCEFLLRYAQNLLSSFRSDHGAGFKTGAGLANLAFAMGHAGQYNSHGAQVHLRRAISQITPRTTKWHDGFDEMHHLCMIVLAWSQYSSEEGRDRSQFRELCMAMIAELRAKLRDGLARLNKGRTRYTRSLFKMMTDAGVYLVDLNPVGDNPTSLTYGWMYLIGRLIERFMADGGPQSKDEKQHFDELVELLVEACQTTEYDEVRYKAHEILFIAFGRSRRALRAKENITDDRSQHGDHYRRSERTRTLRAAWNTHMDGLLKRHEWVKGTLTQLGDDDSLRTAREGLQQPVMQSEQKPAAPRPEANSSFGQKMSSLLGRGRSEPRETSLRDEARHVVTALTTLKDRRPSRRPKLQPSPARPEKQPDRDSHHSDSSLSSAHSGVSTSPRPRTPLPRPRTPLPPPAPPPPFLNPTTPLTPLPLPRLRLPSTPLSTHLSPTSRTISFLTPHSIHVYTLPTLTFLTHLRAPAHSTFTHAALTDTHLAALTRTLAILHPLHPLPPLPALPALPAPPASRYTALALTAHTLALSLAGPTPTIELYTLSPQVAHARSVRADAELRHLALRDDAVYAVAAGRGAVVRWDGAGRGVLAEVAVNDGRGDGRAGVTAVAVAAGGVVVGTGAGVFWVAGGRVREVGAGEGVAVAAEGEAWALVGRGGEVWVGVAGKGRRVGRVRGARVVGWEEGGRAVVVGTVEGRTVGAVRIALPE